MAENKSLVWPAFHSPVFFTERGTPYLKVPGVVLIGQTTSNLKNVDKFLEGFDPDFNFLEYLNDPTPLTNSDQLIKFSGQLCYMAFKEGEHTNNAHAKKYFTNIKDQGHGSVCEHSSFTFLVYGIPRSLTHELVRHRAGAAFSQVSQRYCGSDIVRFVERPEYQKIPELHTAFTSFIDFSREEYNRRTEILLKEQTNGKSILAGESRRELRKKVQQCSRSCLPNETEAPIVVTLNARAARHVIEMRAASPADIEIRKMAYLLYECMRQASEFLFDDYEPVKSPDGVNGLETSFRKV